MPQRQTRTVTSFRLKIIAIAFLAVTGWGGFAYLLWSSAWAERELERHLDQLMSEHASEAFLSRSKASSKNRT